MEFASIEEGKFDVNKPPKAYPDPTPDRNGNYDSRDVDFSKTSEYTPGEVDRVHERADTDTSRRALHHTLGSQRNQASPGDHIHDGFTSKKLVTDWTTPVLNTGWVNGPAGGTVQFLRYRYDQSGKTEISGSFHSTSATPSSVIFVITSGLPLIEQRVPAVINNAGTYSPCALNILPNGNVSISPTPPSGADCYVSTYFPTS